MDHKVEAGVQYNDVFTPVADPQCLYYYDGQQYLPLDCNADYSQSQLYFAYYSNSTYTYLQGFLKYRVGLQYCNTRQEALKAVSSRMFHIQKRCIKCHQTSPYTMELFRKTYCIFCLKLQFINSELFFVEGEERRDWTEHMICDVWEALCSYLPENQKQDLPQSCPLPHNSFLCYGRTESLGEGGWYPGQPAHICGEPSKCTEGGCPYHELCKMCANRLLNCPICGYFISFEEPDPDPRGCTNHCAHFDKPCITCERICQRRKPGY